MHGYERTVLDGVQYITQGGCSDMDVDAQVGPTIYPQMVVGTNKTTNPADFNNGLTNHLLTLEITPETATSKLHYFDATGNYIGVIESVDMTSRVPEAINLPTESGLSISQISAKGIFKINASENVNVTVFNLQGKKVYNVSNMSPDKELNLSSLNQGIYLVKLGAKQKDFSKTIVIE